ncbi:hypothetical protein HXX76_005428 [Chlamydomonas incerta]|uniref:Uncharacterized protein n=1 Tax=Chlamydomonas incerta TaxID=51695 RepID=A0A835T7P7_CHLIN|nr:hypothetical protein HXX76_005428 [Chlamydomonas incerta]|eukprot:KAG2437808.1 hypothetical protein HXX76_005428 [Chlamydomonas incerta]
MLHTAELKFDNDTPLPADLLLLPQDDAEKYVTAEIVGMIVTSFWNFLLSIFFGVAGTGHVSSQDKKEEAEEDKPAQPVAA